MKRILIITAIAVLMAVGYGQTRSAQISFDNPVHDFGTIKEEAGKVSHRFTFVNTGGSPLIIQNVRATCGCTAPDWTRQPIPPGGKGYVAATFNPAGRPNAFAKYLYVDSNADEAMVRLTIKGEVTPKPRTIEDDYRYSMGDFRLKANHLAFGNLTNTAEKNYSVEVVNNGSADLKIDFERVPSHMTIGLMPDSENEAVFTTKINDLLARAERTNSSGQGARSVGGVLKAGEKGKIVAAYDASVKGDWGMLIDRINISVNGTSERNFRLIVSANIVEDFSEMTAEQRANAPKVDVDNPEVNFGTMKQSEKFEHEFILSNDGKSTLMIRKIKASCGCTAVQPEKKMIEPGESVKVKAIFNAAGKRGNQNKTITIITNDPDRSNLILRIKGEVTVS